MTQPFSAPSTRAAGIPAIDAPQHQLAAFPTYAGAERLVDTLSDKGFPVEHVRIVGNGLRSVEYVTGRLTNGRAALAGAASGAWLGLLLGLLISAFSDGSGTFGVVIASVVGGALWFAALGYAAHAATRGRRDFASTQGLEAEQYVVTVTADRADEAIRLAGLL
jgi:hypothetical protein